MKTKCVYSFVETILIHWFIGTNSRETLSIEGNASVYNAVDALNRPDNIALLTSTEEL